MPDEITPDEKPKTIIQKGEALIKQKAERIVAEAK